MAPQREKRGGQLDDPGEREQEQDASAPREQQDDPPRGGLLRRRQWNEQEAPAADSYTFAGRVLDFGAMEVRAHGRSFRLTQMESDLLRYLVQHPGQAVSRGAILENVWDLHGSTDTRAIDNFIVRLRRYIEDKPADPRFLLTVRGVGYRFVPEGAETST